MKIMSYFKYSKIWSQPSTRVVGSRRILHTAVWANTRPRDSAWPRGITAETRLDFATIVYESLHTWSGEELISTSYELICLYWFLKESYDSFLEFGTTIWYDRLVRPIFPRRNSRYLSEVRQNYHLRIVWPAGFKIHDDWPSSHTSAIGYLANRDI